MSLHGRKVIICTTFREFNGNANDAIQRLFLRSLKRQTYQNYILVATTFGEEYVGKALTEEGIQHALYAGDAGEYRFSSTQVVQNAIRHIEGPGSAVLIWTTCDDLFEDTFLEKVVRQLTPRAACTALPHIMYRTMEDYEQRKVYAHCWGGIDTICFDADVFLDPKVIDVLKSYENKGWGYFEYFLSGIARVFCERMYNIWPARIERIDNDRKANNETPAYFKLTSSHNERTYAAFARDFDLKGDLYSGIFAYSLPPEAVWMKLVFIVKITEVRIRAVFWRFANRYTPQSIKSFIRNLRKPTA